MDRRTVFHANLKCPAFCRQVRARVFGIVNQQLTFAWLAGQLHDNLFIDDLRADRFFSAETTTSYDEAIAPRAGARIETPPYCCPKSRFRSLPARERGSKPSRAAATRHRVHRSRAGARIETGRCRCAGRPRSSLPARERGSKPSCATAGSPAWHRSPRGSADRNRSSCRRRATTRIAPRAGARIETTVSG